MTKIAHYLQEHLMGEVTISNDVRRHFAHDASVLQIMPSMIVYPRNENDVRKTARFCWQIAERGKVIPITPRGLGSDQSGAAIGEGIILVFPAHMNRILSLNQKNQYIEVEPGANFDKIQQTLLTHGFFVPSYPSSMQYSTIGGAVANNASGEKSLKYGPTLNYVDSLRVVLANGEVIETGRLTKKELSKKMGLSTFEGEVYRSLDALIEDHADELEAVHQRFGNMLRASGYYIDKVKQKDGSFDLTPLFVGSQGTLGIVTEARIKLEPHSPITSLALVTITEHEHLQGCIDKILDLEPSMLEIVNGNLVDEIIAINPKKIDGLLPTPKVAAVLLVEFDDDKEIKQTKKLAKLQKIASNYYAGCQVSTDAEGQERFLALRRSVGILMSHTTNNHHMVPVAEDIVVTLDRYARSLEKIQAIYSDNNLKAAIWGHVGSGMISTQPLLDLSQLGDRQRLFKITDEIYSFVIDQGGVISGAHNDGRMRTPYMHAMHAPQMYDLFEKVKNILDPFNILNQGVKFGTTLEDVKAHLRSEYTLGHRLEHLPRS